MDINDLPSAIALFRQALGAFKDAQSALPDSDEAREARQKIAGAEKSLQMAEARAAQDLGYKLCKAHWPPEIMLQERNGMFRCPRCEGATPQDTDEGQLSGSELAILRLLYQAPEPLEPGSVARAADVDMGRAKYWLDKLQDRDYIHMQLNMVTGASYSLTREGREYLIEGGYV